MSNTDLTNLEARVRGLSPRTSLQEAQKLAHELFKAVFGHTSLAERMRDIGQEATELRLAVCYQDQREEAGDVQASLFALYGEQGFDPADILQATMLKILRRAEMYKKYGDRKHAVVLGGSFDPIHLGHVAVAQAILNSNLGIERAFFMPACGYMGSKMLTEGRHRAAMCRLIEQLDPRFCYLDFEMRHELSGNTRRTFQQLLRTPIIEEYRLYFSVGLDVANSLSQWEGGDELVRLVPFIVTPRPGYSPNLANPWFLQEWHRYLHDAQGLLELSSTDVRTAYGTGDIEAARAMVPPMIHEYIMEHGLYQPR